MDDRTKTIAAVSILVGLVVIIMIVVGVVVSGKKVVSPIPESGAIKIIFVSPTIPVASISSTPSTTIVPTKTK
jgi:hypothetical protein